MKKIKLLSILLCAILMLECAAPVVSATQSEETTDETSEETTAAVDETIDPSMIPNVSYGSASIVYGCRTLDGQSPLGGSDRLLASASSAFVYEVTTDTVVYAYNPDTHLAPGSLAKIMTAMLALEHGQLSDSITVSTREISKLPVGSITYGLKNGEIVTLEDVLYCLMMNSANDAALVIAEYVAGNEEEFVKLMNARAQELGCTDTNFVNCHGLEDAQQYTSARDMARITVAACENETFREIFGSINYVFPETNKRDETEKLKSDNHLITQDYITKFYDQRVTGGMPSYVSPAIGASISFTAEGNGMQYVYVILGATRRFLNGSSWRVEYYGNFDEAIDLLEYTMTNYRINRILYPGQALKTFQVGNGQNSVVAAPNVSLDTVVPVNAKMSSFIEKYTLSGGAIAAPIEQGDQIATVQLWYGASCVAETELYAMSDVRTVAESGVKISNAATKDDTDLLSFLGILCLIILVPIAVYLTYNSIMRSRIRAKRRRRRASRRRSR